jgi:hypothetical protein
MQKITHVLALTALAILPVSAKANTVTVDFESIAVLGLVADNLATQGFSFSPNCHYDVMGGPSAATGYWLGYDASGCNTGGPPRSNPNYLGPSDLRYPDNQVPNIYITEEGGSLFSLLGITNTRSAWRIESSRGGLFTPGELIGGIPESFTFTGVQWENLSWLLVSGGRGGEPVGFDNVIFDLPNGSVPIPSGLSLGIFALLAVVTNRKRTQGLKIIGSNSSKFATQEKAP